MNKNWSPNRWANHITKILDVVYSDGRFPVDVKLIAKDFTRQLFPDDPITLVKGASLPGFEGALYPSPPGKPRGWGIIYNSDIKSKGRINFTLAHELGHYLVHRQKYPDGLQCSQADILRWDSEYGQIEAQANEFASALLMPLNDFRSHIAHDQAPDFAAIAACADRYEVSLTAATLRWLQYTTRRSVLVVSRDGFIKWARSSSAAYKSGLYFKTNNRRPIPVPQNSPASSGILANLNDSEIRHGSEVWLNQPCTEFFLASDQYDLAFSLLQFEHSTTTVFQEEPSTFDSFDQFARNSRD